MSAREGQALAAISIKTLEILRNDDSFDSIWYLIKRDAASLELPEPTIPRKREKPARYLGEQETPHYNDITEAKLMYKRVYFNAASTIITCIKGRFNHPGLQAYQSIEKLLIKTTNGREIQESLSDVHKIYHQDVKAIELEAQLESLKTYFDEKEGTTLADIVDKMRNLSKSSLVYFSQVSLLKILLVMPETNAVSERSASSLRRIKNWLRTTMTQGRRDAGTVCCLLFTKKKRTT